MKIIRKGFDSENHELLPSAGCSHRLQLWLSFCRQWLSSRSVCADSIYCKVKVNGDRYALTVKLSTWGKITGRALPLCLGGGKRLNKMSATEEQMHNWNCCYSRAQGCVIDTAFLSPHAPGVYLGRDQGRGGKVLRWLIWVLEGKLVPSIKHRI